MRVLTGRAARRFPRLGAIAPVLALVLAGRPAAAAGAPELGSEDPLAAAKTAHARAQAEYETAAYDRAIESWTQAYAALPDTAESATYRPLILYNIARAREKLFELRADVTHLKQARDLLVKFEAAIPEVYADEPAEGESEREKVRARIADLEQKIAKAEGTSTPVTDTPPVPQAEPPATEPVADEPPPAPTTPDRDEARLGTTMITVGSILSVLGIAGVGGMGASLTVGNRANDIGDIAPDDLDAREDQFDRGRRANRAAIALAVVAPLMLGTGVALIVVGAKQRSKKAAFEPLLSPSLVGVSLRGRF